MESMTMTQAKTAFAAGRLQEAEHICKKMLQQQPSSVEALGLLGLINFRAGRGVDAIRLLEQATAIEPKSARIAADFGMVLLQLGAMDRAVERFRVAVENDPRHVDALVGLGNALRENNELEAAEQHYREALAVDARNVRALLSLGNLLMDVERLEESLEFLSAAAKLDPNAAVCHLFLGRVLRELGRDDEAIERFRRAVDINPRRSDANQDLGHALRDAGNYEDALQYYRASGNIEEALLCQLQLRRIEEFWADIRSHLATHPADYDCAALSAYASYQLGVPDPHLLCPDPLDYVRIVDLYSESDDGPEFFQQLIEKASQLEERVLSAYTVEHGTQSRPTLFTPGEGAIEKLRRDIVRELLQYRDELKRKDIELFTKWPDSVKLKYWSLQLRKGGNVKVHDHRAGWISGCLYLQIPKQSSPDEAAIEFSLKHEDYPVLSDKAMPTILHKPRAGQMVLFPSILFHRVTPFQSEEERYCIAFDMLR
jgi:tetratricopeptide (TPR) repeat protein